ncbi:MAG TPA: ornithine cyclodeaminase family protein [Xanthobacteraceae bacterium]|nr:ornithine cyclodeaminase family protein [Xanthobacteraceae bacterium]
MAHEVVFLSDNDVRKMLDMPAALAIAEQDFRRQADPANMIYGVPLAYETEDRQLGFRWRLKTAIMRDPPLAGSRITGFKVDSAGAGGGGERNSTRYMVLSDPATASPLAIVDEHTTFSMRTSAGVCVAAKYLARPDSKVAGIVGVGNIGQTSLLGLNELFRLERVKVMSARPESRRKFASEMSAALGIPVQAVDSYEDVCRDADIVMAGTPSRAPFIERRWLKDGVFVGLMGQNEAAPEVFAACDRLLIDYDPATQKHPAHVQRAIDAGAIGAGRLTDQIWQVVSGHKPGRRSDGEMIVVVSVGVTTQDIAIAYQLYLWAKAKGFGLRLPF